MLARGSAMLARVKWLLVMLMTMVGWSPCQADQAIQWQGYDIHYTTLSSRLIPADVAKLHGIIRADNRMVTNLSIRKTSKTGEKGDPVTASIHGTATNLLNQQSVLDFTEVLEPNAIYYLANQLVDERDTLRYSISIQPQSSEATYLLEFVRDYDQ